jgi:hypothetical protein
MVDGMHVTSAPNVAVNLRLSDALYVAQLPGYSSSIGQRLQQRIDAAVQDVLRRLPEPDDFKVVNSQSQPQHIEFNCQSLGLGREYVMVSAACTGGAGGSVAVGPTFLADGKAQCKKYGNNPMAVEGSAICIRVKNQPR